MKPLRKDIDIVLNAADCVRSMAEVRKSYHTSNMDGAMKSITTTNNTYVIPDEETSSYCKGLLLALSPAAMKLAIQIGDELYMNNALWYYDHQNNRSNINALKELKEKRVIFSLVPKIYYVNPLCIRRGSAITVAEKTKEIVIEYRGVCTEAITKLSGVMSGLHRPLLYLRGSKINLTPFFKMVDNVIADTME